MRVPRRVAVVARGPARGLLRDAQSRHHLLAPRTVTGPPDFVGIGAQRCGTSWWHSLIEQHPAVAPLGLGAKELHFFDDAWRPDVGPDLAERYARHFRRRPGQVVGEWTPRYLLDPWAVPRLLEAAPQVRLLVMLRDPVARFRSGLGHALKTRTALGADDVTGAYTRGLYAEQLARVLAHVPRERLLVLQLEACLADPQHHLGRTLAFLGLDPVPLPSTGSRNAAVRSTPVADHLVAAVREGYRADSRRLVELVGDGPDGIDLSLWRETHP